MVYDEEVMNTFQGVTCGKCSEEFKMGTDMLNYNGCYFHTECFVCEQCFRPFGDDEIYEYDERRYCEQDYQMLYAPQCALCGEFVFGEVIKALNKDWHPECFKCQIDNCDANLQKAGFIDLQGQLLCTVHYNQELSKKEGKPVCQKCMKIINAKPLRFRGDPYHSYHFVCNNCGCDLDHTARDVAGKLYCLPCHDKMGIPICATCRRPIEGRCVNALSKQYHPEHFVCVHERCERPFTNSKYFLGPNNQPYCEIHYNELYGDVCIICNLVIKDEVISALEKRFCEIHFECQGCQAKLELKKKFVEFDMKPLCTKCFEKFPSELKKRIKKNNSKKFIF